MPIPELPKSDLDDRFAEVAGFLDVAIKLHSAALAPKGPRRNDELRELVLRYYGLLHEEAMPSESRATAHKELVVNAGGPRASSLVRNLRYALSFKLLLWPIRQGPPIGVNGVLSEHNPDDLSRALQNLEDEKAIAQLRSLEIPDLEREMAAMELEVCEAGHRRRRVGSRVGASSYHEDMPGQADSQWGSSMSRGASSSAPGRVQGALERLLEASSDSRFRAAAVAFAGTFCQAPGGDTLLTRYGDFVPRHTAPGTPYATARDGARDHVRSDFTAILRQREVTSVQQLSAVSDAIDKLLAKDISSRSDCDRGPGESEGDGTEDQQIGRFLDDKAYAALEKWQSAADELVAELETWPSDGCRWLLRIHRHREGCFEHAAAPVFADEIKAAAEFLVDQHLEDQTDEVTEVTIDRQISDDELWQILDWRPSPTADSPAPEAMLWAKYEVQSADNDLPLYVCRFLRVLEHFRGGGIGNTAPIKRESLHAAVVSGLVVSGFDNSERTAMRANHAVSDAQARGLVIVEDVDEWRPGMKSGSGMTPYVHLTVAGRLLAASRDQDPSLDDGQVASTGTVGAERAICETLHLPVEKPNASPGKVADAQDGADPRSEVPGGEPDATKPKPLAPSRQGAYNAYWWVIQKHPEHDTEEKIYERIREHGLPDESGLEGWQPPPTVDTFKKYLREARAFHGDNIPACQPSDARSVVNENESTSANKKPHRSITPEEQRLRDIDRLREVAADVHLSSDNERARLWESVFKILERLGVAAQRIEELKKTTDATTLLKICSQLEDAT